MKKQYIIPSMRTTEIESCSALMAGSDTLGFSDTPADNSKDVMTKGQSIWDIEW